MPRLSSKRLRQIILIVVLVVALAITAALFINWQTTRTTGLGLDLNASNQEQVPAPRFLFAFAGGVPGDELKTPLGVLVDGDRVFVTDGLRGEIYVFRLDGTFVRTFGKGKVTTPLYVAKNPKTGEYWITDRTTHSIHIFGAAPGYAYKGEFDPKLPKDQRPAFKVVGNWKWAPIGLDFASDGSLYVVEILNGHRLLVFNPQGQFTKSVGSAGLVNQLTAAPTVFQFPNSVKVHGGEVWIADSNNRRIQVFDRQAKFLRFVPTQGLPRGISFLYPIGVGASPGATRTADASASSDATGLPGKLVVVDVLAHDATIWGADGTKFVSFGEKGVADAQFAYPNDVSVDSQNRIYIADTNNGRIQVWGWPDQLNPIPTPRTPLQWALCLSPLLLVPFLLLLRRKRFYATPDFIQTMIVAEDVHLMPARRRRWVVTQDTYDMFATVETEGVKLGELLEVQAYSESEAKALQEKWEVTWPQAVDLAEAKSAKVFCTENVELRRLGKTLNLDVVDRMEFIRRYPEKNIPSDGSAGGTPPSAETR